MNPLRRSIVAGLAAAPALSLFGRAAWAAEPLKISHQFPGSTGAEGDFRDQLCRRFAADIEKRSNGALKGQVYPGSSLMKVNSQFSAMRKGALDLSLVPISYSGGEVPEVNIGLMPALVPSYEVGARLEDGGGRQAVQEDPRRQGHRDRQLDLAGRRRRAAATVRWSRPTTRRA